MSKNYYLVLGLTPSATPTDIRRRFRELARTHHPDRFAGRKKDEALKSFQDITEAFNILSDPERRRQHDMIVVRASPVEDAPIDSGAVSRAYMQRGIKAYRGKLFAQAAESFQQAAEADPKNSQAWHHLALALGQQERFLVKAILAIERAIELDSMKSAYHKLAGKLYARAGRIEEAERSYRQALEWGDDDSAVLEALEELRKGSKGRLSNLFWKGN